MRLYVWPGRRTSQGFVLLSALVFTLVIATLLAGIGTFATSHRTQAEVDADHVKALDIAEAGINTQFRKISQNPALADQYPGTTYSFGGGTYKIYCINRDGTYPWVPGTTGLAVVCTGTFDGVSRTIRVSAKQIDNTPDFALFTTGRTTVTNGTALTVNGDIGSNGTIGFNGSPTINGSIYFEGPASGWAGAPGNGYDVITEPQPLAWPTVNQKALLLFPALGATYPGGLAYIASRNDNARANPPIVSNMITRGTTLVGPGNYYCTYMGLSGTNVLTFDNRLGPVNLWLGPNGGFGTFVMVGGSQIVSNQMDPTKACFVYNATRSTLTLTGNVEVDTSIYSYNRDAFGNQYGTVTNSGNVVVNGQILAHVANLNGGVTLNYTVNTLLPTTPGYYGYDNSWAELNPRNP